MILHCTFEYCDLAQSSFSVLDTDRGIKGVLLAAPRNSSLHTTLGASLGTLPSDAAFSNYATAPPSAKVSL